MTYENYKELVNKIQKYSDAYYKEHRSEISDYEFDMLMRQLEEVENQHPEWKEENSPSARVGSDSTSSQRVKHVAPMRSLKNVYQHRSENIEEEWEELIKWCTAHDKKQISISPKIDGCAIAAKYINNKLSSVTTRGDGLEGDDITEVALAAKLVPDTLDILWSCLQSFMDNELYYLPSSDKCVIEIRGEAYMPISCWETLNRFREREGLPLFANPRNATSGTLKLQDLDEVQNRGIQFAAHGVVVDGQELGLTYTSLICGLANIRCVERQIRVINKLNIHPILDQVNAIRWKSVNDIFVRYPYSIDGAVIKLENTADQIEAGNTDKYPNWAVAVKFLPEQKTTKIQAVTLQVGRTGVITPVAELSPTPISGSVVSRATLHNQAEITRKGIHGAGDTVIIEKAGEIIPAVVQVVSHADDNAEVYDIMRETGGKCPCCGYPLTADEGVAIRCDNVACKAKLVERIKHMCSRKALDVSGVGHRLATALVDGGFIETTPIELFRLTVDMLANINIGDVMRYRVGKSNARKIVKALDAAMHKELHRWIYALGIPFVGKTYSRIISKFIHIDAENPMRKLMQINYNLLKNDIGPHAATRLQEYIESATYKDVELPMLEELGIFPTNPVNTVIDGKLDGKAFCITGTLSQPRTHFEKIITDNGGLVKSSVTKKLDYLLVGEDAGSKLDKAKKLNINIINEEQLNNLIK